ncbi:MAG: hypothetical protein OXD30_01305, partial [Bryobacterales bacterium]|nr:hypothetical protein [Bryobacterales bacterium]
ARSGLRGRRLGNDLLYPAIGDGTFERLGNCAEPQIEKPKSATFFGRRSTGKQIVAIQPTDPFPR